MVVKMPKGADHSRFVLFHPARGVFMYLKGSDPLFSADPGVRVERFTKFPTFREGEGPTVDGARLRECNPPPGSTNASVDDLQNHGISVTGGV